LEKSPGKRLNQLGVELWSIELLKSFSFICDTENPWTCTLGCRQRKYQKTRGSRWIEFHSQQVHTWSQNWCLLRPFRSCKYVVGNNKKCTTWNMSCFNCCCWFELGMSARALYTINSHSVSLNPPLKTMKCPPLLMYLRMFRMQCSKSFLLRIKRIRIVKAWISLLWY
jgi:hypothetical protein